jgi:hypothetical protein
MDYQHLGSSKDVPQEVLDYPSMMTLEEKALLFRLARYHYTGLGVIVDAGLFLGASTEAFSQALKQAGRAVPKSIHAYDVALWNSAGFDKYLEQPAVKDKVGAISYRDGESFFPLLQRLLAQHLELIDFRIGDIVEQVRTENPVEIAFFDCLKNYERDWAVFRALGPHYVPGKTFVIQQDYFYEEAIENKVRQEFLSPYFDFIGGYASSGVFKLQRPVPREYFERDPVLDLSVEDRVALLEQAARRIAPSKYRMYAELAVVRFLAQEGRREQASEELSRLERDMLRSKLASPRAVQVAKLLRRQLSPA